MTTAHRRHPASFRTWVLTLPYAYAAQSLQIMTPFSSLASLLR
ncbi:hypothetical protein SAMN02745947_00345 [Rhodococcus rhodochrous J3]|uniref:Uncharacterized protein n=1 Tax=Rhodococcus rhodochrous J3 TaxID=903528 RepID=A0ABY1M4R1_RHORH|nr:hypothetical protein SAMN02745947_00345 [Rhodococcus rhodochrous J3]SNV18131.1 Uncharacterised protein [Rhodococcus rhodochrous]